MPNPNHIPHVMQEAMMSELVEGGCPGGVNRLFMDLVGMIFREFALKYEEQGATQMQGLSAASHTLARLSATYIGQAHQARMEDVSQPTPTGPLEVEDDDSRRFLVRSSSLTSLWGGLALVTGAWYAADDADFEGLLGPNEVNPSTMSLSEFFHLMGDIVNDEAADDERETYRQISAMAHAMKDEGEGPDDPVVNFREVSDAMMAEEMPGFMEAMDKLLEENDAPPESRDA